MMINLAAIVPSLGGPEMLIVLFAILVLLFGSKKLPELARGIGRASGEFKRGKDEITRELNEITRDVAAQPTPQAAAAAPQGSQGTIPATVEGPKPKYDTNPKTNEDRTSVLKKAAQELGIATDNKSEEELKTEISKKITGA